RNAEFALVAGVAPRLPLTLIPRSALTSARRPATMRPWTPPLSARVRGGRPMRIEARLAELGITLPEVGPPMGTYVHAVQTGNLLFLAGKGPRNEDGSMPTGKVGQDVTVDEAYAHARSVGLTLIAVLKATLGDLDRV